MYFSVLAVVELHQNRITINVAFCDLFSVTQLTTFQNSSKLMHKTIVH